MTELLHLSHHLVLGLVNNASADRIRSASSMTGLKDSPSWVSVSTACDDKAIFTRRYSKIGQVSPINYEIALATHGKKIAWSRVDFPWETSVGAVGSGRRVDFFQCRNVTPQC